MLQHLSPPGVQRGPPHGTQVASRRERLPTSRRQGPAKSRALNRLRCRADNRLASLRTLHLASRVSGHLVNPQDSLAAFPLCSHPAPHRRILRKHHQDHHHLNLAITQHHYRQEIHHHNLQDNPLDSPLVVLLEVRPVSRRASPMDIRRLVLRNNHQVNQRVSLHVLLHHSRR